MQEATSSPSPVTSHPNGSPLPPAKPPATASTRYHPPLERDLSPSGSRMKVCRCASGFARPTPLRYHKPRPHRRQHFNHRRPRRRKDPNPPPPSSASTQRRLNCSPSSKNWRQPTSTPPTQNHYHHRHPNPSTPPAPVAMRHLRRRAFVMTFQSPVLQESGETPTTSPSVSPSAARIGKITQPCRDTGRGRARNGEVAGFETVQHQLPDYGVSFMVGPARRRR